MTAYSIFLAASILLVVYAVVSSYKMIKKCERADSLYERSRAIIDHHIVLEVEVQREVFSDN